MRTGKTGSPRVVNLVSEHEYHLADTIEALIDPTTPGPWHAEPSTVDGDVETTRIVSAASGLVAVITCPTIGWRQMAARADARLIVEATSRLPELAAVVKRVLAEEDRIEELERDCDEHERDASDARWEAETLARRIADSIGQLQPDDYGSAGEMRDAAEAIARRGADGA